MNIMNIVGQVAPGIIGGLGNAEGGGCGDGLLGGVLENAFDILGIQNPAALAEAGGGPGSIVNALLQSLGIPEDIADVVGIATDAATGNIPGVVTGSVDMVADEIGANGEAAGEVAGQAFSFMDALPM